MREKKGRSAAKSGSESPESSGDAKKWVLVFSLALVVVVLDQLTKLWVHADMRLYESIPIIDGFFNLTYVRNTGAAFSIFADMPENLRLPFFGTIALVAGIGVLYFVRATPASQVGVLVACGLILGGAAGNLIDRFLYGSVIDFLDVYYGAWHWPAFNVADSSISVGVVILVGHSFFARE